jgi:O-antigen chain-terminating methyltransferase
MIETTNPEIDVSELMKRVRTEASKIARRSRGIAAEAAAPVLPPIPIIPPMPAIWIPRPGNPKKERLEELLQNARKKIEVSSIIPKFLRGLFRKQGGYNRSVLESLNVLAKSNFELNKKVREISTCLQQHQHWMEALTEQRAAEANWMMAATPQITKIAAHEAELDEVERTRQKLETEIGERMSRAEAHAATLADQFKQIDAQSSALQAQSDELQAQISTFADLAQRLEQRLKELQAQAGATRAQTNDLQTQADATRAQMKDLQAESDATRARANELRGQGEHFGIHLNNLQGLVDRLDPHVNDLQRQADGLGVHINNLQGQMDRVDPHVNDLQGQADRLGVHVNNLQGQVDQRIAEAENLARKIARLEEDSVFIKGELSEQSSMFHQRAPTAGRIAARAKLRGKPDTIDRKTARSLDAFYLRFENVFRGSPNEIKKRVQFYLPYLASAEAGKAGRPVLDLGCGRGEWLELLKEQKLKGQGVDMNAAMIAECRQRKVEVVQADAIEHMRSLRANSQGAVTGFHIIEHLPFETLMEFFGEARRILKPGGIAIFESPNCKNLVVGASNFNIDPTHRNPVFPETAELMLQSHGFERVVLEYLSPVADVKFDDKTKELATLKKLLYGPQDFAVIGYKPKAR